MATYNVRKILKAVADEAHSGLTTGRGPYLGQHLGDLADVNSQ